MGLSNVIHATGIVGFDTFDSALGPGFPLVGQLAPKHKLLIGSAPPTISTISHSFTSDAACNTAYGQPDDKKG
jgi:hypothetical protein